MKNLVKLVMIVWASGRAGLGGEGDPRTNSAACRRQPPATPAPSFPVGLRTRLPEKAISDRAHLPASLSSSPQVCRQQALLGRSLAC